WVVPEKFRVLIPLHPKVRWIVRIHSEIPFLAMEGIAMDWIARYTLLPVEIACNSMRSFYDVKNYLRAVWGDHLLASLPSIAGVSSSIDLHATIRYLPNY